MADGTTLPDMAFPIERMVDQRDDAITKFGEAISLLVQAHDTAEEAMSLVRLASYGHTHYDDRNNYRDSMEHVRAPNHFDRELSSKAFRHYADASIWNGIFNRTGILDMMDHTEKKKWREQLSTEIAAITVDNVEATMTGVISDAPLMFMRGLATSFSKLDRRFKSHDVFKVKDRIILTRLFNDWGYMNHGGFAEATLTDVERCFAKLDGQAPQPGDLRQAIDASRERGVGVQQSYLETRYFRIRTFKNGNAHLWFTRPDLVKKVNLTLAEYYGEVLPDAAGNGSETPSTSTEVAKDLQFYRTPDELAQRIVDDYPVREGSKILEPSAGDGSFVIPLLKKGHIVEAVEYDPTRSSQIIARMQAEGLKEATVRTGNFLAMEPREDFDAVYMNPPFYGTHWVDHVVHAMKFLAPGGHLFAILPATAEIGTSARHKSFHQWMQPYDDWYGRAFSDLPAESFAESGTRVQTVLLRLRKPRA
ncbi:MAG: DUF4942 domain-containing protein [Hyphomonas sp.]|nr:DUF4942 domain-containing protein [Hyphomonas sp.]